MQKMSLTFIVCLLAIIGIIAFGFYKEGYKRGQNSILIKWNKHLDAEISLLDAEISSLQTKKDASLFKNHSELKK